MSAFSAEITANIDSFSKNIDQAGKEIDKFSKNVGDKLDKVGDSFIKVGGKMSIFSGAVAGVVVGMGALALSTANAAKDLGSLSTITGISTDMLQEYELIALKATVPTDSLAQATMSLTRRLKDVSEDGGGATEVLKKLGVSLKDSNGAMKSAGQVAEDAMLALAGLEKGVETNALGVQIFGRQWNNVVQIVDLGADEIANLKNEAHDLGLVLSEDAIKGGADFGIAVDVLKSRISALKNQIGAALAPMLTETLLPLIEKKIMPAFQKFAENIKGLIERFNALSPQTKALIAGITGITVAAGPTLVALGGILKLLPLLRAGFAALTGPVGIAVAAIAGIAILVIKNWDAISDYFTSGEGAELFNSIKTLFNQLKSVVIGAFKAIKSTVENIWDKFGSNIKKIWDNAFGTVMDIIKFTVNYITDYINILSAVFKGDFKGAVEGVRTMFLNIFTGVVNIVGRSISTVLEYVSGMLKSLKLNKWADAVSSFGDKIKNSMLGYAESLSEKYGLDKKDEEQTEKNTEATKKRTEAVGALTGAVKKFNEIDISDVTISLPDLRTVSDIFRETSNELDSVNARLEGLRDGSIYVADVENEIKGLEAEASKLKNTLDTLGTSTTPLINPDLLENSKAQFEDMKEDIEDIILDIGGMTTDLLSGAFASIGDALVSGDSVLSSLGASLLGGLGSLLVQLGEMALKVGIGLEAVKLALKSLNPVLAIAAGVALIAIGSVFAAGSKKLSSSIGGGGGSSRNVGGNYSYAQSAQSSQPMLSGSDLRGAYRDDFKVEFSIGNDELVATLDTANQRRNRM